MLLTGWLKDSKKAVTCLLVVGSCPQVKCLPLEPMLKVFMYFQRSALFRSLKEICKYVVILKWFACYYAYEMSIPIGDNTTEMLFVNQIGNQTYKAVLYLLFLNFDSSSHFFISINEWCQHSNSNFKFPTVYLIAHSPFCQSHLFFFL